MTTDVFEDLNIFTGEGFVPAGTSGRESSPNGSAPDSGETPPDDTPVSSGGPTCEECGVDIPWSGRGRRPKRCQDHKTRTSETAERKPNLKGLKDKARLERITGDLQEGCGQLAGAMVGFVPVTAVTIGHKGPAACAALVRIAEKYPRFLDGLEKATEFMPWLQIGQFVGALVFAIGVDLNLANPYSMSGEWLGVGAAAREAGWEPPQPKEKTIEGESWVIPGQPEPSAPPRFSMK